MKSIRDLQATRMRLLALRAEVAERAARAAADLRRESELLSADFDEQPLQVENDEVLHGLGDASRHSLSAINRALARLDDGSYFTCSRCGKAIDPARLEVLPDADSCAACASRG